MSAGSGRGGGYDCCPGAYTVKQLIWGYLLATDESIVKGRPVDCWFRDAISLIIRNDLREEFEPIVDRAVIWYRARLAEMRRTQGEGAQ